MIWPEKAELTATIQQMLKTVPVGMFAMARDTVDEVVMERLSSKRSVQEVLLEAMKSRRKK